MGGGKIDAGNRNEELDLGGLVDQAGEIVGEHLGFGVDHFEEEELAVEDLFTEGIEREAAEPGEIVLTEEIAFGGFDEALVKDGVAPTKSPGTACRARRYASPRKDSKSTRRE